MRKLAWVVALSAFLLNPGFACGPAEPQYQFGATEMRSVVEGYWSFSITPANGTPKSVLLVVGQAATAPDGSARSDGPDLIRAAYACGGRTLLRSAGACIDVSTMPLQITSASGDATLTSPLAGTFVVYGTTFELGTLTFTIGPYQVTTTLNRDGTFSAPVVPAAAPTDAIGLARVDTR